ncbi:MAG TPA: hypothetical protein PLY93_08645, partial [Turneriella sp.]|nr:hypothetical protein [Turneriella sp.]
MGKKLQRHRYDVLTSAASRQAFAQAPIPIAAFNRILKKSKMPSPTVQLSEIRAEIDRVCNDIGVDVKKISVSFERSDFNLRTEVNEVTDALLIDAIAVAKRHIENWRIHTFEK